MKKITLGTLALIAALFAGQALAQEAVKVQRSVPFAEDNDISDNIKTECKIGDQLGEFVQQAGGGLVQLVDGPLDTSSGRVLQLTITDAVSMGNAWMGHQKFVKIKGTLFEGGRKIATFKGRRNSMGGAFAGFKGSCSVLGRAVQALGGDVAGWLKSPVDGANLGD